MAYASLNSSRENPLASNILKFHKAAAVSTTLAFVRARVNVPDKLDSWATVGANGPPGATAGDGFLYIRWLGRSRGRKHALRTFPVRLCR